MKRRTFLRNIAISSALASLPFSWVFSKGKQKQNLPVPKRELANKGDMLSMIGFGGILLNDNGQKFANEAIAKAVDAGINYFDVAPTYGNAQDLMGPALEPYRKDCFLACKTGKWDKKEAEEELHGSLKALKTDHFDLYQLHAISSKEDVDKALAPNGAIEVFEKAKKEGKIRYIGFSAHSQEAAVYAMEQYDFDTILFPLNFVCWYNGNFGPKAYEKAKEKNMGILALKSMAKTRLADGQDKLYKNIWYMPLENTSLSDKALRFILSKDITAAIPPGDSKFLFRAIEHAGNYAQLNEKEDKQLQDIARVTDPIFKA
ncbi:MAG: aldo/keto reductase [Bacteroidales bacterium]|nr:aldo/keto reductase [Bacteroidales bacterium]